MQTRTARRLTLAITSLMVLTPIGAAAATPSQGYSFLEMDYIDYDNVDGFGFEGSVEIGPNAYLNGGYEELEDTSPFANTTLETLYLGGGVAFGIAPTTDLHFGAAFVDQQLGNFDDSGFQVDAGIRARLSDVIELYGDARHRDFGDFDEDMLGAGIRLHLTPVFHLSAGVEDADNYDGYRIGARFSF